MSRQQIAAVLALHAEAMQAHADLLRATAVEMRAGKIGIHHAANRIAKIADKIAVAKTEPRHRHDFRDGDVCGTCDQAKVKR